MFNISNLKSYDLKKLFRINYDTNIVENTVDDLKYISAENFFENPDLIVEFLSSFPCDNTQEYFDDLYSKNEDAPFIKPAGIQQILPFQLLENISTNIFNLLKEYNYVPENGEANREQNYEEYAKIVRSFYWNTTCISNKIICNKNSNGPHVNIFEYFVTTLFSCGNAEIDFYKFVHNNNYYNNIESILQIDSEKTKNEIKELLNKKYVPNKKLVQFNKFEEDINFVKYHTIEQKFNQLILFHGSNWHTISPTNNINYYSLDAAFNSNVK